MKEPLLAFSRVLPGQGAREGEAAEGEEPGRWLWVLHGIYGAGRNWRTVVQDLTDARPEWGGVLVDLRLHGDSPDLPPPHTVATSAADVERLAGYVGRGPHALLGHSFGGKVALRYLQDVPAGDPSAPRQVWVVDSPPGAGDPAGSAHRMLQAVRSLPARFPSREEAARRISRRGIDLPVARWITTNLELEDSGYGWRLDWDAVEELLEDFFRQDLWGVLEEPPRGTEIHVMKAEGSRALDEEDCRRVERAGRRTGRVRLHRVDGGHWLNADNPEAVVRLLADLLP